MSLLCVGSNHQNFAQLWSCSAISDFFCPLVRPESRGVDAGKAWNHIFPLEIGSFMWRPFFLCLHPNIVEWVSGRLKLASDVWSVLACASPLVFRGKRSLQNWPTVARSVLVAGVQIYDILGFIADDGHIYVIESNSSILKWSASQQLMRNKRARWWWRQVGCGPRSWCGGWDSR